MTDYYDVSGAPVTSSFGSSATIRAEFAAVASGISAKLSPLAGHGLEIVRVNAGGTAQESITTTVLAGLMTGVLQPLLVSGTSIKTINGTSLLGSGNIATGTVTSVGGSGTVNGLTLTGTITSSGSLSLGGTLAINNGDWSGTALAVSNGGSGVGTLTGILKGNGTSAFTAVTAPTGTIVGTTDTQTLTNKNVTPRVGSTTSSATPTINTDNVDLYKLTAQTTDITSFTSNLSGTPVDGQALIIQITGTAARGITWGASFEASTVSLPTTTVTTAMLTVAFMFNSVTNKWRVVGTC